MRITLCARSKILQLLEPGSSFRIQVSVVPGAGQHVDLIPNAESQPSDCTIYTTPRIVADLQTATLLADQTVDFDYDTQEFIVCAR